MNRIFYIFPALALVTLTGKILLGDNGTENARVEKVAKWLGFPNFAMQSETGAASVTDPNQKFKTIRVNNMTDTSVEIGLRADGVVVWRKKEYK